jgi:hypothetical protein
LRRDLAKIIVYGCHRDLITEKMRASVDFKS